MAIDPTTVQAGTAVPAVYQQRQHQTPLRPTILSAPVAPEEVVDYVELQSAEPPSAGTTSFVYGAVSHPQRTVGTLIDVWV